MLNNELLTILINYGLAGIVVYIFYKLISNELRELKESIERLNENITRLIEVVLRKQ